MDIKTIRKSDIKIKNINIKITSKMADWITKNNISPTKVFEQAIKDLMK